MKAIYVALDSIPGGGGQHCNLFTHSFVNMGALIISCISSEMDKVNPMR